MTILLFLLCLEPIDVIQLDEEFNNIEIYNNNIYLAPFTGKSIFVLDESKSIKPITFTDDVNYRIYSFYITPFGIYFNNGMSIEKFYFASGIKESIYSSKDISSFIITSSEEVIFSDRQKRELTFLDFTNSVKFKKDDLNIKDLYFFDGVIYMLTKNSILICDEHGNIFEEKKIPEKFNRIFADSTNVMLFSFDKEYLYKLNNDWKKIEFSHGVRDVSGNNEFFVILGGNGTTLYIYDSSRIK